MYMGHSFANGTPILSSEFIFAYKFFYSFLFNELTNAYIGIFEKKNFFERYINLNF